MMTLRSLLTLLVLPALGASPDRAVAQVHTIDEGTFIITKTGAPAMTESFRLRSADNGVIRATGQLNAGARRVTSALTTDSLGTPMEYTLDVRENGVSTLNVTALARAGRLSAHSKLLPRGDESMREFPVTSGNTLILEEEMLHQLYFVALVRRTSSLQVINPRSSHGGSATVTAHGLEPISVAGRQVTATHYSLVNGSARRDFWVDSAGRVLQIEIVSLGLKATREELPR